MMPYSTSQQTEEESHYVEECSGYSLLCAVNFDAEELHASNSESIPSTR